MANRNVIPDRIAETLRRFPPFSMLPPEAVRSLAAEASVRVLAAGARVWAQGDTPGDELWFLARGRVEYVWQVDDRSELVDVRDVGDVLGLTSLMREEPFRVSAQVAEDSLLYGLPWAALRQLLEKHDEARNYARRHQLWVTRMGMTVAMAEPSETALSGRAKNILQAHLDGAQLVLPRPLERLLTCPPTSTIFEAAELMTAKRVPSILVVDAERRPLGIVTANTLVKDVIVNGVDSSKPVETVMATPVVTVSARSSATAAILVMLRARIGQVCVTEDGTPNTKALDVYTHKDLLMQSGHHPAGLLREIRLAKTPARFRELCDDIEAITRSYLEAGVSGIYLGQICSELYDELVQRLLSLESERLAKEGVALPKTTWAWMSVGSDGRREQILRTDMDNALVFAPLGTPEENERARSVYMALAARVIEVLVAAGFSRCQGGVMALNPRWCRTSAEWAEEVQGPDAFSEDDGLVRATVLYDLRFVAGDKFLCDELRSLVLSAFEKNLRLQLRLAEMIISTAPPLNLIGRFVIEKLGGDSGDLDLKQRGMAPIRDAARLLSVRHKLSRRYSTGGRWDELRRSVPRLEELAPAARDAYDFLLRMRTLNGLRRGDSGRLIDPEKLTKLERAQLANVFDVVRMVQTAVRGEYQLELSAR